jgi:CBS domain containing-hemolysin-like protein
VAAVVNELGETVGILTFDDLVDTIFTRAPSRVRRLLRRVPIRQVGRGRWQVTGMTGVRRLARFFNVVLPTSKSVTVAGIVQECLERFPEVGDQCGWGPFHLKVVEMPDRDQLVVELTLAPEAEETQQ